jgi:hypothetical protein
MKFPINIKFWNAPTISAQGNSNNHRQVMANPKTFTRLPISTATCGKPDQKTQQTEQIDIGLGGLRSGESITNSTGRWSPTPF